MKNFNKKIYSLNMQTTANIKSNIPFEYFKMATNIANSFSKEYAAIGVLDLNDLTQEGYLALLISWRNIKWKIINDIKNKVEKQKAISKYLKKSIKGIISDRIKTNADGVKKPIKGIWDNKEQKKVSDGFSFVTKLFPQKHLPKYDLMFKMFFGIDDIYSKPKKISEIARYFSMPMENVKKQKQRLIARIQANMLAMKELAYFVAIHGIKSDSEVYNFAEKHLEIYRD